MAPLVPAAPQAARPESGDPQLASSAGGPAASAPAPAEAARPRPGFGDQQLVPAVGAAAEGEELRLRLQMSSAAVCRQDVRIKRHAPLAQLFEVFCRKTKRRRQARMPNASPRGSRSLIILNKSYTHFLLIMIRVLYCASPVCFIHAPPCISRARRQDVRFVFDGATLGDAQTAARLSSP